MIYYFSAYWCSPCYAYGPIVEKVAKELGLLVSKIDVDEDSATGWRYKVMEIPTVLLVDEKGDEVKRLKYAKTEKELKDFLSS
jgi:thioredoxin 1